ncbi:UDP-N-acetylmuramyl pentapeptide phosphotransferase/UDP-N-acetylglucosamine-1-phosphate transferase [Saonia flava]|uniref:UDP-N-acetylmuramyl pentapeptide phosphotransferase/UDP-N-acetylglucosamine-1-phosphate transferase n=1 Tax=Saonia flava TaxID=523696 RepID=A0A846R5K2_9FLAO|nr:MraY family glycosyltransferase [Saonia flava]NJB72654.1 UDP-N-acetylmuramyl pentapeptide phosphotransferase/UDP-N-acetylglucosamine-1-phosphate transferase [Saonia flava]
MTYFQDLFSNLYVLGLFSLLGALFLSLKIYPAIINIVHIKNLMDDPSKGHSIHKNKTPTLGGVGLFIAFALLLILFGLFMQLEQEHLSKILGLVAATMILMFLGAKDDLVDLAPKKKFIAQLISASIVIFLTDARITNFYGLLGIHELSYIASIVFTLFVFLLVVNSYNLIDGIDGLAGSIAIICSLSFGIYFLLNKSHIMVLISFVLIGAIIGFLRYNLSHEKKMFMGDSGSLFIGFLLTYQGIIFLTENSLETTQYYISNAPIMLLVVLSFPLLDTLRVFIIRAKKGLSPFTADRNHIHHRLLDLGFKHGRASLLISIINILIMTLSFLVRDYNINIQLLICVGMGSLLYLSPFLISYKKETLFKEEDVLMVTNKTKITQEIPFVPVQREYNIATDLPNHEEVREEVENKRMKKIFAKRLAELKKMASKQKRQQF